MSFPQDETTHLNRLHIDMKLPGLNEYTNANREHTQAGAAFKRKTEKDIAIFIQMARLKRELVPIKTPVRLRIEWHEKTARRDPDNIISAKKFILDALVKCGILPDDSQKYIKGFTEDIIVDGTSGVFVWFEPYRNNQNEKINP